MNKTIVALYDDIVVARQVVEDLVNAEFSRNSISLITNDSQNKYSRYLDKDYTSREEAVTAGEGAGFGAVVGALTGVLAGLAALTIPGIGLAIVAGPIVAGLTGVVAGAVTGGVVSALVKGGVPEDEAPYYAEGIRRGGTLVSIESSDALRAEDIMNRYGSTNIHERINAWREAGWKGFNTEHHDTIALAPEELLTPVSSPKTAPTITLLSDEDRPIFADSVHIAAHNIQPLDEENETPDPTSTVTVNTPPLNADQVLPTLEEDLLKEYEYSDDNLQAIEPIRDHPSG